MPSQNSLSGLAYDVFTCGNVDYPNPLDERPKQLLKALHELSFEYMTDGALINWTSKILLVHRYDCVLAPLGHMNGIDYAVRFVDLAPDSLNPIDDVRSRERHERLVNISACQEDNIDESLAIPVGRVFAMKDGRTLVYQSRWVVLLDQQKKVWALCADDIDKRDCELGKSGAPLPYIGEMDVVFGADRSSGEMAVYLGKLADLQFDANVEVRMEGVHRMQWSTTKATTLNFGDIGVPMFPSEFARLQKVDLSNFKIPQYKKTNFYDLVNITGYIGFRHDINNKNPGIVLGRQVTESAWLYVLLKKFNEWDLLRLQRENPGKELRVQQTTLQAALDQRGGSMRGKVWDNVEQYWAKRAILQPGLDIEPIDADTDGDHISWDMYQAFEQAEDDADIYSNGDSDYVGSAWVDEYQSGEGRDIESDVDMGDDGHGSMRDNSDGVPGEEMQMLKIQ
ncbi:hypothetical protein BKA65DRAFT_551631 [Rhexocercosporidium sp. MPI-PUGE-AT-0058]|nr:hypothetical protein BKA65DRAFT_551631 [Rhexocercosporidium sp. MPI-PUGE-AT-0058]